MRDSSDWAHEREHRAAYLYSQLREFDETWADFTNSRSRLTGECDEADFVSDVCSDDPDGTYWKPITLLLLPVAHNRQFRSRHIAHAKGLLREALDMLSGAKPCREASKYTHGVGTTYLIDIVGQTPTPHAPWLDAIFDALRNVYGDETKRESLREQVRRKHDFWRIADAWIQEHSDDPEDRVWLDDLRGRKKVIGERRAGKRPSNEPVDTESTSDSTASPSSPNQMGIGTTVDVRGAQVEAIFGVWRRRSEAESRDPDWRDNIARHLADLLRRDPSLVHGLRETTVTSADDAGLLYYAIRVQDSMARSVVNHLVHGSNEADGAIWLVSRLQEWLRNDNRWNVASTVLDALCGCLSDACHESRYERGGGFEKAEDVLQALCCLAGAAPPDLRPVIRRRMLAYLWETVARSLELAPNAAHRGAKRHLLWTAAFVANQPYEIRRTFLLLLCDEVIRWPQDVRQSGSLELARQLLLDIIRLPNGSREERWNDLVTMVDALRRDGPTGWDLLGSSFGGSGNEEREE